LVAAQWGVVIAASLAAAIVDVRSHRIPNKITLPLLAGGFGWGTMVGGLGGLMEGAVACVVLAAPFVILFLGGTGGAGDAKLMAAIGAWLGILNGLIALLAVVTAGVVLGLSLAIAKGQFWRVLGQVRGLAQRMAVIGISGMSAGAGGNLLKQGKPEQSLPMPYGVAIFCGVAAAAAGVLLWRSFT
jgi:prepilin peptidase CpaA